MPGAPPVQACAARARARTCSTLPLGSLGTRGSLMSSHAKMVGSSRYATPVMVFVRVTSAVMKFLYMARHCGDEKKSAAASGAVHKLCDAARQAVRTVQGSRTVIAPDLLA